jgi:hypothetical protein
LEAALEPLVQAADAFAAAVAWLLRGEVLESREPGEPAAERLALDMFGLMLHEEPTLSEIVASDETIKDAMVRLKRLVEPQLTKDEGK